MKYCAAFILSEYFH